MLLRCITALIAVLILQIMAGCDNSFQSLNEEKGIYSIYGYLNLYKDVNYIRVKDLNKTFQQDTSGTIDAEVTFKNLESGLTEVLRDSIVEFDWVKTHNFYTTMDIMPGTRYQVLVERSDGKITTAKTTTPQITDKHVDPIGANCTTKVDLKFNPMSSLEALNLEMGFSYRDTTFWVKSNRFLTDIEGPSVTATLTPWQLTQQVFGIVEYDPPYVPIMDADTVFCHQLDSDMLKVRYTHYSPDLYDNTLSDTLHIPGGSGRLGAYYKDNFSFRIDTTKLCPPFPPGSCE